MLIVMGVISILAAIAVPVWSGSKLHGKQACRELIRAELQQARAHAIASRNPTALVIPMRDRQRGSLRNAMSSVEVRLEGGTYVAAEPAALLKSWTLLPEPYQIGTSPSSDSSHPTVTELEHTLRIRWRQQDIECHFIVFSPNGQIVYPPGGVPILMTVGRNGSHLEDDRLIINRFSAKARGMRP